MTIMSGKNNEGKNQTTEREIVKPDVLRDLFGFQNIRSIDDLVDNKVIEPEMHVVRGRSVRRYDKDECTKRYIQYLKDKNRRKPLLTPGSEDDNARRLKADADLKEARAEIEKMRRDELQGRLHSSDDVKEITGALVTQIRGELLALPGTCAMDCAAARTAKEAEGVVKREVLSVLKDLERFQYNRNEYKKRVRERTDWMSEKGEEDDG